MIFIRGSLTLLKKFEVIFFNLALRDKLIYLIRFQQYNLRLERGNLEISNLVRLRVDGLVGATMPLGTLKKSKSFGKVAPNGSIKIMYKWKNEMQAIEHGEF